MTLHPLSDLSPADWYVGDAAPLGLRSTLGPSGFTSYARLLHGEMSPGHGDRTEGHLNKEILAALCEVLAKHTTTPDDCCFALWEGYGDIHGGEPAGFLTAFSGPPKWPSRIFTTEKPPPPIPPAFPPQVMEGPLLTANGQDHFLFGGPLSEAGQWGAASYGHGIPRDLNSPNLMWPTDRAWFVTTHIEGTWTGIGGSAALIDDLLRDDRLEVVRSRFDEGALR